MSATYDFAQGITSPVQTMFAQQERLRNTVMGSSRMHDRLMGSFEGTIGARAALAMGPAAKTGWVPDTSSFARSLNVVSVVQDTLADQQRMHDRVMRSFGPPATVAGSADIYATAGLAAKGSVVGEPFGFAKSLYAYPGVASAVKDTLTEQQRMRDRMMKSLGPSGTVAGTADIYGTAGLVAKGSVVDEPFGLAKSLDAHRGAAYISPPHNRMSEMLRSIDSLTTAARAAVAHGTLGLVTGVGGYGPGLGGVGTIAGFTPSLTDVGGPAMVTDQIARLERAFTAPSAVADMARALAGSAHLAGTVRGVDPFTGLAVPMGIGEYLRTTAVAGERAMPAGGPAEPILIVPDRSKEPLFGARLWLPSIRDRRKGFAALWAFKELVGYAELEAGVRPPGHVMQLVSLLWAIAFAWSEYVD